jgi:glycogen operon protein
MLLFGDECRRTQQGNNNAYCQDNPISWFDWKLVDKHANLIRFCRALIAFRRRQPTVRRKNFFSGKIVGPRQLPDVAWFSPLGTAVDWRGNDKAITCFFAAPDGTDDPDGAGRHVLLLFNADTVSRQFVLPVIAKTEQWRLVVDTAAIAPQDVYPNGDGPAPPRSGRLKLLERSMRCYVACADRELASEPKPDAAKRE